jgi:hypothetical protein
MAAAQVRYLVFDVESASDGALVAKVRYNDPQLDPADAIRRYRDELIAKYQSDFVPYTYQVPVSVVVAKVGADFRLIDLVALDEPQFRSHVITENFWRGWEAYRRPTLVSFNGRTFDIPLLELAAFRYGLSMPGWFNLSGKTYEQSRNRYNVASPARSTCRATWCRTCTTKGGWPKSTTTAAATCSTPTSSSSALPCCSAGCRWRRSRPSSPKPGNGSNPGPKPPPLTAPISKVGATGPIRGRETQPEHGPLALLAREAPRRSEDFSPRE